MLHGPDGRRTPAVKRGFPPACPRGPREKNSSTCAIPWTRGRSFIVATENQVRSKAGCHAAGETERAGVGVPSVGTVAAKTRNYFLSPIAPRLPALIRALRIHSACAVPDLSIASKMTCCSSARNREPKTRPSACFRGSRGRANEPVQR